MARPPQRHFLLWYLGIVLMNVGPAVLVARLLLSRFWFWQIGMPLSRWGIAFVGWVVFLSIFEWFFHRYALHRVVLRPLDGLYRAHTHHHDLTPIRLTRPPGYVGPERLVINQYPITEPHQHEDAAFPPFATAIFWGVFSPLMIIGQFFLIGYPVILSGMLAVVWSLFCYEVLHWMAHWPYEWWKRSTEHPLYGGLMRTIYSFHHFHHANISVNEGIGGFFGLPIADILFGTFQIPPRLLLHDHVATVDEVTARPPARWVQALDAWARKRHSNLERSRGR